MKKKNFQIWILVKLIEKVLLWNCKWHLQDKKIKDFFRTTFLLFKGFLKFLVGSSAINFWGQNQFLGANLKKNKKIDLIIKSAQIFRQMRLSFDSNTGLKNHHQNSRP